MKGQNYFVGLDIGTDSVGYAVTDEHYELCRCNGEAMWGVTLFDAAELATARRGFRSARRRLDRRQQRVQLIQDLFAEEISKVDEDFFRRIKESYLYPERDEDKIRLFDTCEKQKAYMKRYPTIHHLIVSLMRDDGPHDVRLVYLACAWLVAHRGHFLSDVSRDAINEITSFESVYDRLVSHIVHDEYELPWDHAIDLESVRSALTKRRGVREKSKVLAQALFHSEKAPKEINERYEYNYECIIKLLSGGTVDLCDLFGNEAYADLEDTAVSLHLNDEVLAVIMQSIGDDAELISVLKSIYDWAILVDVLCGLDTISLAKVHVYEQHQKDLRVLKYFVRKYAPHRYNEVFRSHQVAANYAAYIGKNKTNSHALKVKKAGGKQDFCKYILSIVKALEPDPADRAAYDDMLARLSTHDFMPKQVDGDNRVIPYQLYRYELKTILDRAESYIPFLREPDQDGVTGKDKILSVFIFRIPYYVGPLRERGDHASEFNHWMVRRAQGKIYPWNFERMVDLDKSEEAFIARMTNTCTYLPGEDVLPKNSLIYCAFEVLNEINGLKINGDEIPVEVKQGIYTDLFMRMPRVTPRQIRAYLQANGLMTETDTLSGIDTTIKSSLRPFLQFKDLVNGGWLNWSDVEKIIQRATFSEDKQRFRRWLHRTFDRLPQKEFPYIVGLCYKGFGRLSKKFLCGIGGAVDPHTGEYMSIIRTMWETNCNLMQLLSDRFDFKKAVDEFVLTYYRENPACLADRLDEMSVSNAVKRPLLRTLDILKEIVKVQKRAPTRIFIEMARGENEQRKGRRTTTRLQQIRDLYQRFPADEVRDLQDRLDAWKDTAHDRLQSDKLFLYFLQFGRCLYTDAPIDLESLLAGDGRYNIEHIYPRSFVKDDSVLNNLILVDSKANEEKGDHYPIDPAIRGRMHDTWARLHKLGAISDEKFERLTRKTPFTDEEVFAFINRQLVETRQSTKVVATLLKEFYPDTEIVYVRAGLISDFRQQFDLPKSRMVNDLHHAKDAYLSIVTGNVWYCRFSRRFWRAEEPHNAKVEVVFTRPFITHGETIWSGAPDKDRVVQIARKNTAHVTKYAFCKKGGFFDQQPLPAKQGLVPLKKGRPTEIYGGYDNAAASFFVLVQYTTAKKRDILVMPVDLLYADAFRKDESFAALYAQRTIERIVGRPVDHIRFLPDRRIIKINTELSLNGFSVCITGKSSGGKNLCLSCISVFKTSPENEAYIKRIESFIRKSTENSKVVCSEKYDKISSERNVALYDYYVEKWGSAPYCYRPANPRETLQNGRERFIRLSLDEQAKMLGKIQGLFGRVQPADLSPLGGAPNAAKLSLSASLSNWKKKYTDVRIIDRSASGLFKAVSVNLLDLL